VRAFYQVCTRKKRRFSFLSCTRDARTDARHAPYIDFASYGASRRRSSAFFSTSARAWPEPKHFAFRPRRGY